MIKSTDLPNRRLLFVLLLSLAPWPAVWLGMYVLHNLVWTFFLYHGLCLLPAAVWGRKLWLDSLHLPKKRYLVILLITTLIALPLTLYIYHILGNSFIDASSLLTVVTQRGFKASWYVPLGFYFVPVNAVLEELFWRGVVLNELKGLSERYSRIGAIWTAFTFAAWHYLPVRLLLRPGWAELAVGGIVLAGVLFSWLYRKTGSIILPTLWHALVFDLALILIFGSIIHAVK